MTRAALGYACGWTPVHVVLQGLPARWPGWEAGMKAEVGVVLSCVLLESAGAGMVSAVGKGAGTAHSRVRVSPTGRTPGEDALVGKRVDEMAVRAAIPDERSLLHS